MTPTGTGNASWSSGLAQSDCEGAESLTLVMWYRLQDLLFQGLLIESERQHDGRRPLLPPQLLTDAEGRDVQVQVVRVKHGGPVVQRVDEQPLGGGGCPAATC